MHKELIEELIDRRTILFYKHEVVQLMQQLAAHMQADIDQLMLKYCPEEMTEEQLNNWEKCQAPVSEEQYNDVCRKLGFPTKS